MGKCYNCKFLRHHKQPDSIGICTLHWVTAIDSLCGCSKGADGKYTLKNFSIENSAPEVTNPEVVKAERETMDKQKTTLTFSIEGKIITDVAREHFYVRNDMAKALDLLCAGLQSDQLNEYERMALALRVLDGKAEIRGTYPGDSYGLYDLDEPDCRFSIADHIGKLAKKLETAESELHDLQMKFSLVAEGLSDTQKREANSAWFSLDYDHRRPIFDDVESVPLIPGLTSQLDSFLERMTGPETTTDDYGWLEPSGKFHEVPFGEHQGWAWNKVIELGFPGDASGRCLGGDVLLEHGWVLLDNPCMGLARPTTSDTRPMTKAQREFLFDYYTERNRQDLAKKYLEEGEV